MVDRRRELETFRSAALGVTEASPAVIHLTGDAGIGRTRLLKEFAETAEQEGAAWLITRNLRAHEQPFGSLLQAEASPSLGSLIDAFAVPSNDPDDFGRLLRAVAESCHKAPLWLMMDDLHAADEATQAFIERLLGAVYHGTLRGHRCGMVLSLPGHDGEQALRQRLDAHCPEGAAIRMTLGAFTRAEVQTWLESHFTRAPDHTLVELLGEASGGNPRLLAELAHELERTGLLREVDGRLATSVPRENVDLPGDMAALLRERAAALSSRCHRALTTAAFLGQEFEREALAGLLKQQAAQLDDIIDEAEAASLLERRGPNVLAFKFAGVREFFYAAPDKQRREKTHLTIGQRLVDELGSSADDHCLTITHHLIRAGDQADPQSVLRFAAQAGDIAFRHHSYYLAGRYFEAAVQAGTAVLPARERAALHCKAGEAFQRWSDGRRSTHCFEHAVHLYQECGDVAGFARALQGILRNRLAFGESAGNVSTAAGQLERLLGELSEQDVELKVRVYDTLAAYYNSMGRYEAGEACAQNAMDIAQSSDDPTLRCIPVTSLALAQMEQLRLTDAKTTWLEGLSYDRAAGATRYEGLHLQRLPVPLYCLGEVQGAARYNQASYQHNKSIGNTAELSLNLAADMMIANLVGDFDAAIRTGREAMSLIASTRYLWGAPTIISALAYALTMQRRFGEAGRIIDHMSEPGMLFADTGPYLEAASRLRQLVDAHQPPEQIDPAPQATDVGQWELRSVRVGSVGRLCIEAELALLQQRPQRLSGVHDALEHVYKQGVALSTEWCCSIPRSLGASAALRGDWSRATAYFREASSLAERLDAPVEKGRVALYRGLAALGRADTLESADSDLADARACFESHRVPALVLLADEARARAASHQKIG